MPEADQDRDPASILVEGLDPRWDDLIDKCMLTRPDKRYQHAEDILHDLRQLWEPEVVEQTVTGPRMPDLSNLPIALIVKSVVILTIIFAIYSFISGKLEENPNFFSDLISNLSPEKKTVPRQSTTVRYSKSLANGSFENGLQGWKLENYDPNKSSAAPSQDTRDGRYLAKLIPSSNHKGWAKIIAPITANLKHGDRIKVSAWIKAPDARYARDIQLQLRLRGMSRNDPDIGSASSNMKANDSWQKISLDFRIPPATKWPGFNRMEIEVYAYNLGRSKGEIQVDHVVVDVN